MAASKTLKTRLLSSQWSFNKFMIKNIFFFWRMNIYLRKNYILLVTQTFCVKIYFWKRYIYIFTFLFIFFSVKKVLFSKKPFHYKKKIQNFFSANNAYFVKNTNIFSKKKFFCFNLVLQQLNNHKRRLPSIIKRIVVKDFKTA